MSKSTMKVAPAFEQTVRLASAKRMLVAAIKLVNEHQKRLSVGNPSPHEDPSEPGEYPKLRTGFGRSQFAAVPMSVEEIATKLKVTIGAKEPGFYMEHLAENRGRKGLIDTLDDKRAEIARAIAGEPTK